MNHEEIAKRRRKQTLKMMKLKTCITWTVVIILILCCSVSAYCDEIDDTIIFTVQKTEVDAGENIEIGYEILCEEATEIKAFWMINESAVASVAGPPSTLTSKTGKVTYRPTREGKCTLQMSYVDGEGKVHSQTCEAINVINGIVININAPRSVVNAGETYAVTYEIGSVKNFSHI